MTGITDSCHRPINYLRISVTDRCNLRCVYCMPAGGVELLPRERLLTYEEIVTIASAAAELGIDKIRLTGGEPLLRANLTELVAKLAEIKNVEDISLTTNGILLKGLALELKQAGLKRVNVSLDSLQKEKFERITRFDRMNDVLEGIDAARAAGLNPVKINVVAMRGINDDEILDFAQKTLKDGWHVRFIEVMPFASDNPPECHSKNANEVIHQQFMPINEIKEVLSTLGTLVPSHTITGNGPAKYFSLPGATGTIGFISPISEHFCFNCNRIRLTADGKLRPCLLSDKEIDLRDALRASDTAAKVRQAIIAAIQAKPRQHNLAQGEGPGNRFMSQVGG
jgi:cyclic pyranopterin phosphate synthase